MTSEQVTMLEAEIRDLNDKRDLLKQQLKLIQRNCNHDFIETAMMRKCRICKWTESIYY
jgi:hypothetical protein